MTPAAPCCVCGTTGGPPQANTHRAARVDLTRYGVAGVACYACYQTVMYRYKNGLDVATGCRKAVPPGAGRKIKGA